MVIFAIPKWFLLCFSVLLFFSILLFSLVVAVDADVDLHWFLVRKSNDVV